MLIDWLARRVVKRSLEILEEDGTLVDILHLEIERWVRGEIIKQVNKGLDRIPDKLVWQTDGVFLNNLTHLVTTRINENQLRKPND